MAKLLEGASRGGGGGRGGRGGPAGRGRGGAGRGGRGGSNVVRASVSLYRLVALILKLFLSDIGTP
jgi:hypothetical protein